MIDLLIKGRTAFALGIPNLIRVIFYRLSIKFRLHPVQQLSASIPKAPFFQRGYFKSNCPPCSDDWQERALYFGWMPRQLKTEPPDWYFNPFTSKSFNTSTLEWWRILDFDGSVGDIKVIWEASRFNWVLAFAQKVKANDHSQLDRMNNWLEDWCINNPPYCGSNWKCGQEASIRVMHLAMAALILEQTQNPAQGLIDLVKLHLQRIAATLSYAVAQDNNHGTSEAAALFIGGSWLELVGVNEGKSWHKLGRKWLKNRVFHLIENDGSFSQYSVNYHRMMLDTMCMVELWRRHLNLSPFP
ncbi:heparinase II/III family protein, partial [Methyloglobulus sp.]|uniref:heparinase II/III family protein n=1 Tax=Methyloglobulus sp. TaxID=2518622 RepID=UPI0032B7F35F